METYIDVKEEKRVLKAIFNLETILAFKKVGMLSKAGGKYLSTDEKFCAIGCILPLKEFKKTVKKEDKGFYLAISVLISELSKRNGFDKKDIYCRSLLGITLGEATEIQREFDHSWYSWDKRLKAVKTLLKSYKQQLKVIYGEA